MLATNSINRRLAALLGLSAVWTVLLCAPALAHAGLLESTPDEGAALSSPPQELRLRFSEPVDAEFEPIEVRNSQGQRVEAEDPRVAPGDPELLVAELRGLTEGTYTVDWRVTSRDGHPIDGEYEFSVRASADDAEGAQASGDSEQGSGSQAESESAGGSNISSIAVYGLLGLAVLAVAGFALVRRR